MVFHCVKMNIMYIFIYLFYLSVENAEFVAAICWGSNITAKNKEIKKAGSVLGTTLEPMQVVRERIMLHKLVTVMENNQQEVVFSQRLLQV